MRIATPLILVGLAAATLAACGDGRRTYAATGIVREVQLEYRQVIIEHDEIPGLMPAMTMNFDVADPSLLRGLESGQVIDFTVALDDRGYHVVGYRVKGREGDVELTPGLERLLAEREPAPAFELIDQDGEPRSLESLRGKAVVLDFVYTSCPGPCPILTGSHVDLQRSLPPELRERTWFVSISLDPERDTPEALTRYARQRGADLSDWSFLTGPTQEVAEVVERFGVGSVRQPDGEIDHRVVTFLIDPEGRVARLYVGLDHGPDELRRGIDGLL